MNELQRSSGELGTEQDSLTSLRDRRKELTDRRRRVQSLYYALFGVALLAFVMLPLMSLYYFRTKGIFSPVSLLMMTYALVPLSMLPAYRLRLRDLEIDIQDIDFQTDLLSFEVSKRESRAEKVLRINDAQLRRYYDLNLSQNLWVFGLGAVCIFLGVGIIASTLYLVLKVAQTPDTQIITAVLGGVGALLTNFVAAIYLKMNTSATDNLAAFHARLVDTHQLLLGSLIASRIESDEKRWETLSTLSLRIVHPRAESQQNQA
ncbi:hypothetical protein [Longimicrobium sp.]|uniref:hypothetical protein n=1 Tax=Longimicrobium sp. TaxID=2029185 RepID=UPI003B3BE6F6